MLRKMAVEALRNTKTIPAMVVVAMAGGGAWFELHSAVAVQPFYLERTFYERDAAGTAVLFLRDIVARRGDGTTVTVENPGLQNPPSPPALRKVTMTDGSTVWLIDDLRVKTSWAKMASEEARTVAMMATRPPQLECNAGKLVTGRESLGGLKTIITTVDLDTV